MTPRVVGRYPDPRKECALRAAVVMLLDDVRAACGQGASAADIATALRDCRERVQDLALSVEECERTGRAR